MKATKRTLATAIEEALLGVFTRVQLETVLPDELGLIWTDDIPPEAVDTRRDLIRGYTSGWSVPALATLATRIDAEFQLLQHHSDRLRALIAAHARGDGVHTPARNLIFAANGPKPDLVLRDAVSNTIEIVANAEHCLVYDKPVPPQGLHFSHLVAWWRDRERLDATIDDQAVAKMLHARLRASLDGPAEHVIFDTYARRYGEGFALPALIPQVYLHYDPYDQRTRRATTAGTPLARQRMDFLLLFSDRKRVVIEGDGKQHYADGDTASPRLYSEMVAEDRRLRLAGYEVYRFGGHELTQDPSAGDQVAQFFLDLHDKMK